jgi:hypothetical protein
MYAAAAPAAVVFDDHFTGNSGDIPAGWSQLGAPNADPDGIVVESGTLVTITDPRANAPTIILSSTTFNPLPSPASVLTATIDITSMAGANGGNPRAIMLLGGTSGNSFLLDFNATTQAFFSAIIDGGGIHPRAMPGSVPNYAGGAIQIVITADSDSIRVTADVDSYDSGDILFSAYPGAIANSLDDFGPLMSPGLAADTDNNSSDPIITATVAYNRVLIEVTEGLSGGASVPEPSSYALGLIGLAGLGLVVWRRRSRIADC